MLKMKPHSTMVILYILMFTVPHHVGLAAPLDSGVVTKLLTAINSLKAALPSTGGSEVSDRSSDDSGNSDKKAGQPTSFHMDDRSPEIEVKTSDLGINIKTKPASLQVLSTPVEPVHTHVHEIVEHHNILSAPHFIAPPEIIHPVQPIYYGGGRHHIHPFWGHFHHNIYHPYGYFPYRNFYHPSHHILYHEGHNEDNDYDDDDDEDGDKKERIPITKKEDRVDRKLKARKRHGRIRKNARKRDLFHFNGVALQKA